jgi:RimJ/RimL family protein N-acetyltransferase
MDLDIRKVEKEDADKLMKFLRQVDQETDFMLYEPGERKKSGHDLRGHLGSCLTRCNTVIVIAVDQDQDIIGYLAIYGGRCRRNSHVGTLSCAVLKKYWGHGVATVLFWNAITILFGEIEKIELTVMVDNVAAINLYRSWGFNIEGTRVRSIKRNGEYIGEFYMGVLTDQIKVNGNVVLAGLDEQGTGITKRVILRR